jgi:hypothetical protein
MAGILDEGNCGKDAAKLESGSISAIPACRLSAPANQLEFALSGQRGAPGISSTFNENVAQTHRRAE